MTKPNTAFQKTKPPKPFKDFPLTPHPSGKWCKSIRGKLRYFGRWGHRVNGKMIRVENDGWREALELYEERKDKHYAGLPISKNTDDDALTIASLCNQFLTWKKTRQLNDELTLRTWKTYYAAAERLIRVFGNRAVVENLNGPDFEKLRADITKTNKGIATKNEIIRIRSFFNFAYKSELIEKPIRYGVGFDPPSRKTLRIESGKKGVRMFSPDELRSIIDAAPTVTLKAMILIGANSGMGNSDIGRLTLSAVNLEKGWVNFPRQKTGTERRFPLWPETAEALRASLATRPKPLRKNADLFFLRPTGSSWTRETANGPLSMEFRDLLKSLGLYEKGRTFYSLRRGFQTIGEEAEPIATSHIMGHIPADMASVYRQSISDERLKKVTDHVHDWLFENMACRNF